VACLISRKDEPLSVNVLTEREKLRKDYAEFLPNLPVEQWRRIQGEQEIITHYDPERAISTLPALLTNGSDQEKLLALLDKLSHDERVQYAMPTTDSTETIERVYQVLAAPRIVPRPGPDQRPTVH